MCSVMLPVTPNENGRIIYRCEHGTYHLGWNRGMLHLAEDELRYLASLLSLQDDGEYRAGSSMHNIGLFPHMTRDGVTYFDLRVWEAGLRLSVGDLDVLKTLVWHALQRHERQSGALQLEAAARLTGLLELEHQPVADRVYLN